ncbi:Fc.00g028810.m01.CDS01 [Cosmosporella sp. VM-42]
MTSPRASPLMILLGAIFFFSANVFAVSAVLGVDLGTEYIKAALVKPGIPLEIVLTKDSRRKETSAVGFKPSRSGPKNGEFPERLYGADAMAVAPRFPSDVYPNLKALLGLPIDEPVVQEYAARHPSLDMQSHPNRNTAAFKSKAFVAEEEAWMVEELLAMELQSVQKNAELTAGDGSLVRSIVLTVPPFYTIDEKRAVQTAAELAGLKVLSLVSDGLAVGLNYATSRQFPSVTEGAKPEYNMVFDMGAGSTKATVMRFQSRTVKDVGKFNKTVQEVQVLGTGWDRTLGGDALNNLILDDMVNKFLESKVAKKIEATEAGVRGHGRAIAKLSNQVGKIRHVLSANQHTQASFEGLYEDVDLKYKVSRAEFEALAETHAERVANVVNDALKMSGLDIADLDTIILHGGVSRTPFVQKALEKIAGSAEKIRSNVNSDEAAVFGAGFRAAELSPSFRVKEIRISEGAMYPSGLKWTTTKNKLQRQRLWTPISPQGGAPKEVTFTENDDFSVTFYQQVGSEEKDTKTLSTKNLTATVAAMKEQYPSCVESGVQFKLGLKLSAQNGEVEIVKAAVECEAEVKEGFVDGVKNLFGFGKKDQEVLNDEEANNSEGSEEVLKEEPVKEEKEEVPESSTTSTEATESSTTSEAETTTATEEVKTEVKKKQLVFIPVDVTVEQLGIPELTKAELTKSKDRLKSFAASDKARLAREEALNQLEGFTYKVRDIIEGEAFIERSTEEERTKLAELSSATSDWLYEDGTDASKDDFKAKLKELQDLVSPIQKRIDEAEKRPGAVEGLKKALEQTTEFVTFIRKQIDDYEAFQASASASSSESTESSSTTEVPSETPSGDFDGLEDEAETTTTRTTEDIEKEKGPVPPVYKVEDLNEVEAVHKLTSEWLAEMEAKQDALGATDNPVLLVKDLKAKRDKLDKVGIDLALKGAKSVEDKTKKAKKSAKDKKKKKKTKTASADPSEKTLDFDNIKFTGKDGEMPTDEELEAILKKIKLENTKKADKKDDSGKEKPSHDEL